jgi:hypothetical protein
LKIAEALAERSDCEDRIEDLKKRLECAARVQEGEQPPEDPGDLLSEMDRVFTRLLYLIRSINRTNMQTAFADRQTIADAIVERDALLKKRDLLSSVAEAASTRHDRYSKSEVRFIPTVPVGLLRKQIDLLSNNYRELDLKIQELNWKTDLLGN